MDYGVESPLPDTRERRFTIHAAARHFKIPVGVLKEYIGEGLIIPISPNPSAYYFTERDKGWIETVALLLSQAHLTFEDIRTRLAGCSCWQVRHCDFHSKSGCPLISDPSKPCWVNRSRFSILSSYPCYGCRVYRSAPVCESLKGLLAPQSGEKH